MPENIWIIKRLNCIKVFDQSKWFISSPKLYQQEYKVQNSDAKIRFVEL